jgi:hypothetical protein
MHSYTKTLLQGIEVNLSPLDTLSCLSCDSPKDYQQMFSEKSYTRLILDLLDIAYLSDDSEKAVSLLNRISPVLDSHVVKMGVQNVKDGLLENTQVSPESFARLALALIKDTDNGNHILDGLFDDMKIEKLEFWHPELSIIYPTLLCFESRDSLTLTSSRFIQFTASLVSTQGISILKNRERIVFQWALYLVCMKNRFLMGLAVDSPTDLVETQIAKYFQESKSLIEDNTFTLWNICLKVEREEEVLAARFLIDQAFSGKTPAFLKEIGRSKWKEGNLLLSMTDLFLMIASYRQITFRFCGIA